MRTFGVPLSLCYLTPTRPFTVLFNHLHTLYMGNPYQNRWQNGLPSPLLSAETYWPLTSIIALAEVLKEHLVLDAFYQISCLSIVFGTLYNTFPTDKRYFETLLFLSGLGSRIAKRKIINEKALEYFLYNSVMESSLRTTRMRSVTYDVLNIPTPTERRARGKDSQRESYLKYTPYYTQKCLLGLVGGGVTDSALLMTAATALVNNLERSLDYRISCLK
ncbi:hypothetical protein CCUS01_15525 [Colletotrichum cuscutae]|uniref:Uncharacterized protein n=1 Tax=Colletotrichum cuscutae TaxID=1209917 RepID=A0AAI9VDS2_9PEZI|nr:hypothetical protein CCUS01_15525 [Colletotrichum cuscutae]